MTLFGAKLAQERPEEIAIRDERKALRWAEVDDTLNRAANSLHALDLGPNRRIAVFAENAIIINGRNFHKVVSATVCCKSNATFLKYTHNIVMIIDFKV